MSKKIALAGRLANNQLLVKGSINGEENKNFSASLLIPKDGKSATIVEKEILNLLFDNGEKKIKVGKGGNCSLKDGDNKKHFTNKDGEFYDAFKGYYVLNIINSKSPRFVDRKSETIDSSNLDELIYDGVDVRVVVNLSWSNKADRVSSYVNIVQHENHNEQFGNSASVSDLDSLGDIAKESDKFKIKAKKDKKKKEKKKKKKKKD